VCDFSEAEAHADKSWCLSRLCPGEENHYQKSVLEVDRNQIRVSRDSKSYLIRGIISDGIISIHPNEPNVLVFSRGEPRFLEANAKLIDTGDGNLETERVQHPDHGRALIKDYESVQEALLIEEEQALISSLEKIEIN